MLSRVPAASVQPLRVRSPGDLSGTGAHFSTHAQAPALGSDSEVMLLALDMRAVSLYRTRSAFSDIRISRYPSPR